MKEKTGDKVKKMDKRLQILIESHQRLDDEADELSDRAYLTPRENMHLRKLKILRLRAKEAIDRFLLEEG